MSLAIIAGAVSTALAVYSGVPYIRSVLNGKTKPHQLSWLVFTIMNGMVFLAQFLAGGRISTLVSLTFFFYSLTIFGLSFKKGVRKASFTDKVLFSFAVMAMIIWVLTKSNDLAIWLTLAIDLAASTMIILKIRRQPRSEDATPWAIGTLAYVFSCATLYSVNFGILFVRPIYGLVCDAAIVGFIYYFDGKAAP